MIISITSLKGGVGKSTLTQNLAVCFAHSGYRVCIVDADLNQSSLKWSGLRDEKLPPVFVSGQGEDAALSKNVKMLNDQYDLVFIDGTPSLSKTTSKILLLADLVLIPILPSGLDIWATEQFLERYNDAVEQKERPIPAHFILNQHDDRLSLDRDTREALEEVPGIGLLKTGLKTRRPYRRAVIEGMGVYEFTDARAKEEIIALAQEIGEIIGTLNV
jgi:chromosome partitioning protein